MGNEGREAIGARPDRKRDPRSLGCQENFLEFHACFLISP
jgi:hypothetical protein